MRKPHPACARCIGAYQGPLPRSTNHISARPTAGLQHGRSAELPAVDGREATTDSVAEQPTRRAVMRLETYSTDIGDLSAARWQARVDLAAAHRLAVMHGLHEGIFNH